MDERTQGELAKAIAALSGNAIEDSALELFGMLANRPPDQNGATMTVKVEVTELAGVWSVEATAACKRNALAVKGETFSTEVDPRQMALPFDGEKDEAGPGDER